MTTIRVRLTSTEKEILEETLTISSHDRARDVIKAVLMKHGIDLENRKQFDMLVHHGGGIKSQVLLSTELPGLFKRELTTSDFEPLFEIRDFRTISMVGDLRTLLSQKDFILTHLSSSFLQPSSVEKAKSRKRATTISESSPMSPTQPRLDPSPLKNLVEVDSSPEQKPFEKRPPRKFSSVRPTSEIFPPSVVPKVSAAEAPSAVGSIDIRFQGTSKPLDVTTNDTTLTVLAEGFKKFSIEAPLMGNFSVFFIQDGRGKDTFFKEKGERETS